MTLITWNRIPHDMELFQSTNTLVKDKGKDAIVLLMERSMVLISISHAIEPVGWYTTESVTHGQCDARPTVTFPAIKHQCHLASTNLYCLVTEAHVCEQLAQGHSRSKAAGT